MMRVLIAIFILLIVVSHASAQNRGIVGKKAPEWKTSHWHQLPEGKKSLSLSDYQGKVVYLYFFQSWCPGCHSSGFPTLQKMTRQFAGDPNVEFVVIQTTFEGHSINNASKLKPTADRYQLKIPFGQSAEKKGHPDIMKKYRTGGTPWTVIIDKKGVVQFNDFHTSTTKATALIKKLAGKK